MNPEQRRRRIPWESARIRHDAPPVGWPSLSVRVAVGERPVEWFVMLAGRPLCWSESEATARARLEELNAVVARRTAQGVGTTFADLWRECGPHEPYRFDAKDPPVLALYGLPWTSDGDGPPKFPVVDPPSIVVDYVPEPPPPPE